MPSVIHFLYHSSFLRFSRKYFALLACSSRKIGLHIYHTKRRHIPESSNLLNRAVSHLRRLVASFPLRPARVRVQVRSCGICGGQSGTGAGFLRVLRFPCQFSFHRLLHIHHLSTWAGRIRQLAADVPSGLSLTPPQETKKKTNLLNQVKSKYKGTVVPVLN
jgi:hypothetical protein